MLSHTQQTLQSGAPSLRVALIAMPWSIFNRPSVQLGVLKAYLEKEAAWITTETFYPYLEIAKKLGTAEYHWISQDSWLSEILYGTILFPELEETTRTIINKSFRKADRAIRKSFDADQILSILKEQITNWAHQHDWGRYHLIGFSVSCNQLLSSLTAAHLMKATWPQLSIAFGGSSCAQNMGVSLLRNFPQIDYIISGEGEIPLLHLCEFLDRKRNTLPSEILSRALINNNDDPTSDSIHFQHGNQIDDLGDLPVPDYQDYFKELQIWFKKQPFIPVLPVEFSRGCWWGKCAFCNLNLQWCGYRKKRSSQMMREIVTLAERHSCLDFSFTDNALPKKESIRFFKKMADLDRDFRFFGEVKATMQAHGRRELFETYCQGGLTSVQVGIESLSNSLLTKMRKGTTVIDNIATIKDALQSSVMLVGNLITEFPGSSHEEVEETLQNLDFVLPFHPLSTAAFFLGYGSPVDKEPERYGIRTKKHHLRGTKMFPQRILDNLELLVKDYRGDRTLQRKRWKPVAQRVKAWQNFYRRRGKSALDKPPLSYRDGGHYIIIRQELPNRPTLHHRLQKLSRNIYLYCSEIRDIDELKTQFNTINQDQLLSFLESLVQKRLMFTDKDKYLSLAIRYGRKLRKA